MRMLTASGLLLLLSGVAIPQSPESKPKFEAADIHAAGAQPAVLIRFMRGGTLHGKRYEIRGASMADLISEAYRVDVDKVFGGPSWLEMDRFDIFALAPAKSSKETLDLMLQSLLADRFKLVAQAESRPLPAIAITQGKRVQLKQAGAPGEPGCKMDIQGLNVQPPGDGPRNLDSLTLAFSCHSTTIASFAEQLPIPQRQGELRKPVVDKTGLEGAFDFEVKVPFAGTDDLSQLSDAIDKQIGLKLETVTMPAPVVEVKSVNEKPTPNSPEEMKIFPPLPTEFDVAEIKPFKADADNRGVLMAKGGMVVMARGRGGRSPQLQNGRVNLQGYTMKQLIMLAWDLPSDNTLAGAPKWMDSDRFTVIAKVPDEAADAFTDMDAVKPLLRKLLLDRFKMTVHDEERQLPGYVLTAAKPKLRKADPNGRTKWINGPGPDGKDPRNGNQALGRLVTFQNVTMAQFAEMLPSIAQGYLWGETVLDQTGLEGAWDFTFYFSPAGAAARGGVRGGGDAGSPASAVDPSVGIPLPEALTKELGLKLETQKRAIKVLVIDHAEQTPVEN